MINTLRPPRIAASLVSGTIRSPNEMFEVMLKEMGDSPLGQAGTGSVRSHPVGL